MIYPSPIYEEAMTLVKEGYYPFPMHVARKLEDGITYLCTCGKFGVVGAASQDTICKGKHPVVSFSEWENVNKFGTRWENYGIGIHVGKSHCWVLDIDGEKGFADLKLLTDKYGELPTTRTVRTGGGGIHYYFAAWVDKVSSGFITDNLHVKGNCGNAYVVAPPSKHYSGNKYEYILRRSPVDAPEWLLKLVSEKKLNDERCTLTEEQLTTRSKYEIPIIKILTKPQQHKLHREGSAYRGSHPQHDSDTGRNFTIDLKTNRWFCNRHHSHGGLFELASILSGICKCEDFVRNREDTNEISVPVLQGKKFIASVQYCLDSGINPEDLKVHISRGKYERK
jgi:hypothetical protein